MDGFEKGCLHFSLTIGSMGVRRGKSELTQEDDLEEGIIESSVPIREMVLKSEKVIKNQRPLQK